MMRCCRAVPLLLAAVAAQRRGSNYHKGLDDASGLEVAFTSRLSPLYRWACAKAKVGDAIAIEHSGWWGPDWSRQFDANGDEPLTYVLGQANILKGLSLAAHNIEGGYLEIGVDAAYIHRGVSNGAAAQPRGCTRPRVSVRLHLSDVFSHKLAAAAATRLPA